MIVKRANLPKLLTAVEVAERIGLHPRSVDKEGAHPTMTPPWGSAWPTSLPLPCGARSPHGMLSAKSVSGR